MPIIPVGGGCHTHGARGAGAGLTGHGRVSWFRRNFAPASGSSHFDGVPPVKFSSLSGQNRGYSKNLHCYPEPVPTVPTPQRTRLTLHTEQHFRRSSRAVAGASISLGTQARMPPKLLEFSGTGQYWKDPAAMQPVRAYGNPEATLEFADGKLTRRSAELKEVEWRCPICWDMLRDVLVTECGHRFCGSCIKRALGYNKECPSCRAPIASHRKLRREEGTSRMLEEVARLEAATLVPETVGGAWSCAVCTLTNVESAKKCAACQARKPKPKRQATSSHMQESASVAHCEEVPAGSGRRGDRRRSSTASRKVNKRSGAGRNEPRHALGRVDGDGVTANSSTMSAMSSIGELAAVACEASVQAQAQAAGLGGGGHSCTGPGTGSIAGAETAFAGSMLEATAEGDPCAALLARVGSAERFAGPLSGAVRSLMDTLQSEVAMTAGASLTARQASRTVQSLQALQSGLDVLRALLVHVSEDVGALQASRAEERESRPPMPRVAQGSRMEEPPQPEETPCVATDTACAAVGMVRSSSNSARYDAAEALEDSACTPTAAAAPAVPPPSHVPDHTLSSVRHGEGAHPARKAGPQDAPAPSVAPSVALSAALSAAPSAAPVDGASSATHELRAATVPVATPVPDATPNAELGHSGVDAAEDEDMPLRGRKTNKGSAAFVVGMRVQGQYLASTYGARTMRVWYDGSIAAIHADGRVDIDYDDGDKEARVKPAYVRRPLTIDAPREGSSRSRKRARPAGAISAEGLGHTSAALATIIEADVPVEDTLAFNDVACGASTAAVATGEADKATSSAGSTQEGLASRTSSLQAAESVGAPQEVVADAGTKEGLPDTPAAVDPAEEAHCAEGAGLDEPAASWQRISKGHIAELKDAAPAAVDQEPTPRWNGLATDSAGSPMPLRAMAHSEIESLLDAALEADDGGSLEARAEESSGTAASLGTVDTRTAELSATVPVSDGVSGGGSGSGSSGVSSNVSGVGGVGGSGSGSRGPQPVSFKLKAPTLVKASAPNLWMRGSKPAEDEDATASMSVSAGANVNEGGYRCDGARDRFKSEHGDKGLGDWRCGYGVYADWRDGHHERDRGHSRSRSPSIRRHPRSTQYGGRPPVHSRSRSGSSYSESDSRGGSSSRSRSRSSSCSRSRDRSDASRSRSQSCGRGRSARVRSHSPTRWEGPASLQLRPPPAGAHVVLFKLFVANLPRFTTVDQVRRIFSPYGRVHDVNFRYAPGQLRGWHNGCCTVTFASVSAAFKAIRVLHRRCTLPTCDSAIVVALDREYSHLSLHQILFAEKRDYLVQADLKPPHHGCLAERDSDAALQPAPTPAAYYDQWAPDAAAVRRAVLAANGAIEPRG